MNKRVGRLAGIIFGLSLLALLLIMGGCVTIKTYAYAPQRIEMGRHTLVLHATRVDMENAYTALWASDPQKIGMKERGEYAGFITYAKKELHCFVPWPEECMLHEYKHLGTQYGLKVPDDPHFQKKKPTFKRITSFTLTGH